SMTHILLHGFGQRFDLTAPLVLYLVAACGVVFLSFVLVVLFIGEGSGEDTVKYPRRPVGWLTTFARTPWPRGIGGAIGILSLLIVVVCGFFGSSVAFYNPAEYFVWIYFWAVTVIVSGLVGNLWFLLNPWAAVYDAVTRFYPHEVRGVAATSRGPRERVRLGPARKLPGVGVWPATVFYFSFACLELTSGMS